MRKILAMIILAAAIVPARAEYLNLSPSNSGVRMALGDAVDWTGKIKADGITVHFGNSANYVPVIGSGGKLPISIIPDLPTSIITSGTFADNRIASAGAWNAKENGLGNPAVNGYMLVSTTGGARSWIAPPNGISSATAPLNYSGGTISITQATTSTNGYLSSTDWNTFNSKIGTISVTANNGISQSVAGGTITLGLGAITPSSVAASGTVTGSNLSGINTGDQTITLTGNVTGSGTGSFTATIANSAVTLAKMADVATATVFYRKTAGTGAPEVNTLATLKTDLGLAGSNSGDVTLTGESYLSITGQVITVGAVNLSGTHVTGTLAAARAPAFAGDVTSSAGSLTLTIANSAVTLAKMANMATASFLGRNTAGTGAPEVVSAFTAKTMLNLTGTNSGDVTLTGQNYLSIAGQVITVGAVDLSGTHATGTIAAARMPAHTGDVTSSAGSLTLTLPNIVTAGTNPKITYNAKGQVTGGSALAAGDIPTLTLSKISDAGTMASQNASGINVSGGSMSGVNFSGSAPFPNSQGLYFGWNYTGGTGESDFVNHRGLGAGGYRWYNTANGSTLTQLASLDSGGNFVLGGGSLTTANINFISGGFIDTGSPYWTFRPPSSYGFLFDAGSQGFSVRQQNRAYATDFAIDATTGNVSIYHNLTVAGTFFPADYDIGVAASYSANVVLFGDSLHQQLGGINSYFGTGSIPALGSYNGIAVSPSQGQNVAVAGTTIQYWRDNTGLLNATYRREAGINIAVALIGTNTLTAKTVKEVYSEIEALCRHLRATGWRVVLVGLLSRGGSNGNGSYDSQVASVNAFLRQNWAQFADRFIDWGVINSGSNPFNTGGYSNGTYYTGDQLHQQVAGAQALAGYEVAAINDLLIYYMQTHRNQFLINMNKASHDNVSATGMLTLRNENPVAGQSEINFSFYNGSAYVLKENIRGEAGGVLNYGATVGHIFYAGSTGPDVYGTNGSDGPPAIFAMSNTAVVSYKGLSVVGPVAYSNGTGGLYFGYDSATSTSIISSVNPAVVGKQLEIYGYPVKLRDSNTGGLIATVDSSGITLNSGMDYLAAGNASVVRIHDNVNTVLNPVTNGGSMYMNWDRGTAGLGVIFGNGAGSTVGRFSLAGGLSVGSSGDPGAGRINIIGNGASVREALGIYNVSSSSSAKGSMIRFHGADTLGNEKDVGGIVIEHDAEPNYTQSRMKFILRVSDAEFEAARFNSNGSFKIGDGAPTVYGDIGVSRSGGNTGVIYFNSASSRYLYWDGTQYALPGANLVVNGTTYTSSRTVKKNIRDWNPGRKRLRARAFERTVTSTPDAEEVGFVAEEVAEVLPEAVRAGAGDPNDPTAKRPPGIDPMVIIAKHEEEIQALQDQIDALRGPMPKTEPSPAAEPSPTPTATPKKTSAKKTP